CALPISARIAALGADLVLAQGPALAAVAHPFHGLTQRLGQAQATAAVALQQLQRHALRGLLADAGQDAQGVDELADQRCEAHGKGTAELLGRRGLYPRPPAGVNRPGPAAPGPPAPGGRPARWRPDSVR